MFGLFLVISEIGALPRGNDNSVPQLWRKRHANGILQMLPVPKTRTLSPLGPWCHLGRSSGTLPFLFDAVLASSFHTLAYEVSKLRFLTRRI